MTTRESLSTQMIDMVGQTSNDELIGIVYDLMTHYNNRIEAQIGHTFLVSNHPPKQAEVHKAIKDALKDLQKSEYAHPKWKFATMIADEGSLNEFTLYFHRMPDAKDRAKKGKASK